MHPLMVRLSEFLILTEPLHITAFFFVGFVVGYKRCRFHHPATLSIIHALFDTLCSFFVQRWMRRAAAPCGRRRGKKYAREAGGLFPGPSQREAVARSAESARYWGASRPVTHQMPQSRCVVGVGSRIALERV